jgi:BirA family transcriptional regulator, biotin operon repressor / biotin---[acetyl-CoA-carboxylase] ligase
MNGAAARGWVEMRVIAHDTISSTNAEALRLARAGERGPLWITAKRQTAGRGRRGRTWVSEVGNLYATLLITDACAPDLAPQLSFVAALAVHDSVARFVENRRLALKWPNDGLIDGRKFAGVLIEGEGTAIAVGIGINCAHHPAGTAFPATDLAAARIAVTPDELLAALSNAMTGRLALWHRGQGFAAIRGDWHDRAFAMGETIRVSLPEGEREGRFEGIDDMGRMLLRRPDGTFDTVTAGDVLPDAVGA